MICRLVEVGKHWQKTICFGTISTSGSCLIQIISQSDSCNSIALIIEATQSSGTPKLEVFGAGGAAEKKACCEKLEREDLWT